MKLHLITTILLATGMMISAGRSELLRESRKLFANDGKALESFSNVMAISGDFVAVGVETADLEGVGSDAGAVYLYERHRGEHEAWGLVRKITASDPERGARFGSAVAFDGNILAVGARNRDFGKGAIYYYERDEGSEGWGEIDILTADDAHRNDQLGTSLAFSGDSLVVGAPDADVSGKSNQGAVYVFEAGNDRRQVGKLTAQDGAAEDRFGRTVDLSGRFLAIGAPEADIQGKTDQGATYLLEQSNSNDHWALAKKIFLDDGVEKQEFGSVFALSGDTLAVGLQKTEVDTQKNRGVVHVFSRDYLSGDWNQLAPLKAQNGKGGDEFGNAVALSGYTLAVGAQLADFDGKTDQGAVYQFRRDRNSPNTCNQEMVSSTSNAVARDRVGSTLALSGNTLMVGSAFAAINGNSKQGAAYVFEMNLFERWLREQFGDTIIDNPALRNSTWGNYADPDHDSLTNLEEAYYGTDPQTVDFFNPDIRRTGNSFHYKWSRHRDFLGVIATPQWSRDLEQWHDSGFRVRDITTFSNTDSDTFEAVYFSLGDRQLFFRLRMHLQSE